MNAKEESGYWLPEIVHLHLTALEAGWLTAALQFGKIGDVEVNVRGPNGEKIPSTMARAIGEKLRIAWESAVETHSR